jgi:hypothetical protein
MKMKKKDEGWIGEDAKAIRAIGCGNGLFGCGKQCRILQVDPVSKVVTAAEGYHAGVHLCLGCANSAAYNWQIGFDDLDMLMVALLNARAGKCGVPPTKVEVWTNLEKLGVKPVRRSSQVEWSPTKPATLPVGDRV